MFQFSALQTKLLAASRRSNHVSTRLTREGLQFVFLLMFVLFAAILQNINMLVLMAGAFSAMLLIQWRLCSRTLSEISAKRVLPTKVQAQKPFSVQITLTNPRKWLGSWFLMIRDRLAPNDTPFGHRSSGFGITLMLDRLLPNSTHSVSYLCTAPSRGSYTFSDPELSTRFPISLMRGFRPIRIAETIIVHPTQGVIAPNWRDLLKLPVQGRLRRQTAIAGGDGEFYGLRDYRAGDPTRHIHWRTSAKRGELVIRQFEREENRSIGVVLDLFGTWNMESPEHSPLELSIELVATLIDRVVSVDRSVVTIAFVNEQGPIVSRIQTSNQLNAALDRLAMVRCQTQDKLPTILHQTLRYTGGRDPIIVVSTRSKSDFFSKISVSSKRLNEAHGLDLSTNIMAAESRFVWLDVSRDLLVPIFVKG